MTVHAHIPAALLESVTSEDVTFPLVLVVANPGEDAVDVATSTHPMLRIAHIWADPTVAPAPYFTVQIEANVGGTGWVNAYTTAGGFFAPWNGAASAVSYHAVTSPYVFTEVTFEYAGGVMPHDSTVSFRVTVTSPIIGWGHFPWGHMPWGHVTGTSTSMIVTYTFGTADEEAPKLLSAVATVNDTVRLVFDDTMRVSTPDGRAVVTTATDETAWGALPVPGTIIVSVDGGAATTYTVDATMLSLVYPVTAVDIANLLPSLIDGTTAHANDDGTVSLYSVTVGDAATLQVTGGTMNAVLQFPTMLVTGNDSSALSASNYTIARNNVYPAVAVHLTPQSVEAVDAALTTFDLAVQWPMTPQAPYEIAVAADVTDHAGNAIDATADTAAFLGFQPPIPAGRVTKFPIPQAAYDVDDTQELRAFINALEEVWNLQLTDIDNLSDVWDPDVVDETRLDLHLKDQGNPFTWAELDLTLAERKKLLRVLPDLYNYRGTDPGIEAAILTLLGIECHVASAMLDVWTLGVSLLGDYYPAQVVAVNPETYNFGGGSVDLWVIVDAGHAVNAVSTAGHTFTLAGRNAAQYVATYQFRIYGSAGNDGMYTVVSSVESGDDTVVTVVEAIPSAVADGTAIQTMQFTAADFLNPALATADEVVDAIAADIYGGAAIGLNPGGGNTVAIASMNPAGSIQVVGGTANAALAFDVAIHSATGGCVLGPGTARERHTFDLVVTGTLPSAQEEVLMRRIANWAKPVNTHLGRIRNEYVVEDDGIWRLGRSRLGADTVLG
ncbi:MAG: hypothetical protein PHX83_06815 [Acidobacteriia bacterium]|nr:hypothetical protein [Terriglobia bacterium]